MLKSKIWLAGMIALLMGCAPAFLKPYEAVAPLPGETHFKSLRQLTYGGTNAEAYWSFDGRSLIFQHKGAWLKNPPKGEPATGPDCDAMYILKLDELGPIPISHRLARTTCGFFTTDNSRVIFSSTMVAGNACPAPPDMSKGYVWPIYPSYRIYSSKADGSDSYPAEPAAPRAYTAETTVCHDGSTVFTSDRDGDLELYTAKTDKQGVVSNVKRITKTPGYDGGAFFSPDCKKLVWRASRHRPGTDEEDYFALLEKHLVKPGELELWSANADGTDAHQVTRLGTASFAPNFTPDGKRVIFASNRNHPGSRKFDLFMIDLAGTRLEQVTHSGTFDSFPMFSPDGRYLAFSSNRAGSEPHETNVFVAEWQDTPQAPLSLEAADPADRLLAFVQRLSAPETQGRAAGSPGAKIAVDLIAERFRAIGLKPYVGDGMLQAVPIPVEAAFVTSHNVVGSFGEGCGKKAPVVIGAHWDHLGMGGRESLEPTQKGLHAGADDNASGVAAVLEAARILQAEPKARGECFVFAAFAGEEVGIVGSSALAKALDESKRKPRAMLNLDMVGRMRDNKLIIFGTDSAREWKEIIQRECTQRRLSCPGGGDGYGPSDHMAFYLKKVPVLHIFTGPHVDYHRTSDTWDKVNATGAVQSAEVVAAVALRAATRPLHYKKATAAPMMGHVRGKGEGFRSYLGTIPDYSTLTSPHGPGGGGEASGGVKLAGARPGSPADQAGVQAGDVLAGISDKPIRTLQEFTDVLTGLKPGEKVVLKIRRGDKAMELPAVIGSRSSPPAGEAHP